MTLGASNSTSGMAAILGLVAVALIQGCADSHLLFASATTFGLKIAVAPNQPQPLSLTVGYDQYDAAIVPTTIPADRQPLFAEGRLCKTKDAAAHECDHLFPESAGVAPVPIAATVVEPETPPSSNPPKQNSPTTVQRPENNIAGKETAGKATTIILQGSDLGGAEYRREPPTTVAAFDASGGANVSASPGAQFKFGKLFATGIAAQNISESINFNDTGTGDQTSKDSGTKDQNSKECIAKLTEKVGNALTSEQISEACKALAP